MLSDILRRARLEPGFTLIEILAVILIIGILAAVAIPSFINQSGKASDTSAKELARAAENAAETFFTDSGHSYSGLTPAVINGIEPSIPVAAGGSAAWLSAAAPDVSSHGYSVTATSSRGEWFMVTRNDDGSVTRTCGSATSGAAAGGCAGGSW